MKDICLLNDSFPPLIDGVSNTVANYARVISSRGVGVSVVTPGNIDADDSAFNFPVIRYSGINLSKQIGYTMGNPFSPSLLRKVKSMDVGLLHSHCPAISNFVAMELRAALDVPIVLTYHTKFDIEIKKNLKGYLLTKGTINMLVDSVSSCDELWVVSRGAGENIRSLGYKGDYIVMNNGVDMKRHRAEPALVQEVSAPYDLPAGVPVFLFVGRLQWYKGIRIILDALAALNAKDIDFRMVFVGKGLEEDEIKRYTAQLGLERKCFFTGPVYDREKLAAWYTRADLFLFPSTFDTNGLVVREASACSLGSVLVKDSCASEGVQDGIDGLLIDENAESLASCLMNVIGHPEVMRRIGQAASGNLYLSWDDAVSIAMERYGVVMENYRSGKYPKCKRGVDGFMKLSTRLMGL